MIGAILPQRSYISLRECLAEGALAVDLDHLTVIGISFLSNVPPWLS